MLLLFAAPMIAFVSAARTLLSISAALVTAGAHAFATHVSAALASAALASALLCLFFSLSQYAAPVPASLMSTAPVSACFLSADLTNLLPLYLQLQ